MVNFLETLWLILWKIGNRRFASMLEYILSQFFTYPKKMLKDFAFFTNFFVHCRGY